MSDYEFLLMVRQAIVNRAAEVFCYNWDNTSSSKLIKEIPDVFSKSDYFRKVDPNEMTVDQLDNLGFQKWDDESGLMLIPLYVYPFLKDEFMCGSISDIAARNIKASDIDTYTRYGCLAYGVLNENKNGSTYCVKC